LADGIEGKAKSESMKGIADGIIAYLKQKNPDEAQREASKIRSLFGEAASLYINIQLFGSNITEYTVVNETGHENIENRLLGLCEAMGLPSPATAKRQTNIENDMLLSYILILAQNNMPLRNNLAAFHTRHKEIYDDFIKEDISDFTIALDILKLYEYLRERDIPTCFPELSANGETEIKDVYDITLLTQKLDAIIPNDYACGKGEDLFILTGINSGGKTSYLRSLGIAAVLFSSGLFIPAKSAKMPVFSRVITQFADNDFSNANGRFIAEKEEIYRVLEGITSSDFLLINEIFSSTDENNALAEYGQVIKKLDGRGIMCLLVTHFHRLTQSKTSAVNLNAPLDANGNPTYRIIRDRGSQSNIIDLLRQYGMTFEQMLKGRPAHG
jgi:DNA mismatch repair ATPase MutS